MIAMFQGMQLSLQLNSVIPSSGIYKMHTSIILNIQRI